MSRIFLVPLVAVLILTGCGSLPTSSQGSAQSSAAAARAARVQRQQEAWHTWKKQMAGLVEALSQIDSRLDVGMNASELSDRLGDASVAYDRIPVHQLSPHCADVGVRLENAFNEYGKSLKEWQQCINDYYCEVAGAVLAKLRGHWS